MNENLDVYEKLAMKILRILLLIALFSPDIGFAQAVITHDEYVVYDALLRLIYREERKEYQNVSYYVIYRSTKTDEYLYLEDAKRYRGLATDFLTKNKIPATLENKLFFGKYYLVDQKEIDDFFEKARAEIQSFEEEARNRNAILRIISANYWRPFYEKYPEAYGLYSLSRVGFTKNKEYAVVQIIRESSLTGYSRTYVLRKVERGWRIVTWSGSSSIS